MNWGPHRWRVTDSGCWEWQGCNVRGYGIVGDGWHKKRLAHRVALEQKLGRPLGAKMQACHACDNPPCVNPLHLYEATQLENLRDQKTRGRTANRNTHKTHCQRGHALDGVRKGTGPSGVMRYCTTCERKRLKEKTKARVERARKLLEGK